MGGFMFAFLKKKKSIYLAVRWRGEYPSLSPTLSWITALVCTVSTTQAEQLADQTVRQPFCLSFSFSTRAATVQQHALQVRAYLTFSYTVACTVHCCVLKVILFGGSKWRMILFSEWQRHTWRKRSPIAVNTCRANEFPIRTRLECPKYKSDGRRLHSYWGQSNFLCPSTHTSFI